jgi:hypothetical protein
MSNNKVAPAPVSQGQLKKLNAPAVYDRGSVVSSSPASPTTSSSMPSTDEASVKIEMQPINANGTDSAGILAETGSVTDNKKGVKKKLSAEDKEKKKKDRVEQMYQSNLKKALRARNLVCPRRQIPKIDPVTKKQVGVTHEEYDVCGYNDMHFSNYGLGMLLYFVTLRHLAICFFILAAMTLPSMWLYVKANYTMAATSPYKFEVFAVSSLFYLPSVNDTSPFTHSTIQAHANRESALVASQADLGNWTFFVNHRSLLSDILHISMFCTVSNVHIIISKCVLLYQSL